MYRHPYFIANEVNLKRGILQDIDKHSESFRIILHTQPKT